tara:strand:- start:117629 stop:118726 length:1098 start_codon:yes stop_codon:yes gene_type:complete
MGHAFDRPLLDSILDLARWAPSGDNAQPWLITINSETAFTLDISKFKKTVYNLLPMPDLTSIGMFIENASIAAQKAGYALEYDVSDTHVTVELKKQDSPIHDELTAFIKQRSVNRFPYKLGALKEKTKDELLSALGENLKITWLEDIGSRSRVARLMMRTTNARLRIPETYQVHKDLIDWSGKDSETKLPILSLGMSKASAKIMNWVIGTEKRNKTLMSLPGTTLMTQIELDLLPALFCSGHFIISFDPEKIQDPNPSDYIQAGRSMQRFWLTLAKEHMVMQPWYATLMFSLYLDRNISFTKNTKTAQKINTQFKSLLEHHNLPLSHVFFTGRVGFPKKISPTRSIRKPVSSLIVATQIKNDHST